MQYKNIKTVKSQKGVTLTALVIYIIVFTVVISIMSVISNYFFRNIGVIKNSPKYTIEFNKFSMFFVSDMKRNSAITSITSTSIEFADGTKYVYKSNRIYRNGEVVAKYVKSFTFTESDYVVDEVTKKIVNVNTSIGNEAETIDRNVDFVLRYW